MARRITFTGEVIDYQFHVQRAVLNGHAQLWPTHTYTVMVRGKGIYIWSHRASEDEKLPIQLGETHSFTGIVAVEIIGGR